MKLFMTAIALAIAAPAAAQTAPAQPHQHQGQDHSQHGQHQGQDHGQHSQHQGPHQGPAAQGGCCADRNGNGRMDCCENMARSGDRCGCCPEQAPAPAAQPQGDDGD